MKFIHDTTTFMTDSHFKTLQQSACWWIRQWTCNWGLRPLSSISRFMRPISPLDAPTILGAPSVVMLASLDQSRHSSPIVWHTLPKISSPVVVPFRLFRAASSSDTSKFELTPRRKISSCAVSCTSLLSSSANAKNSNSFTFSCSWAYTLSPISSIRLVIVLADRLTAFKTSFLSGHTSSATAFIHFLTNSPSLNGLPLVAISLATWKLARKDDWFSWVWRTNVFCWADSTLFSFDTLSALIWPCKLAYFSLWRVS